MLFTRSTFFIACTLAAGMGLSACSKSNNEEKQAPLTASTPATGEASTLTERNAQQRLISTLQDGLKKANINAKITDAQPTEVPNLYWISFEGMPSVYATADGKYILQGEIVRLGGKELHNVSQNLQAANAKKLFDQLKTEDLIVYPAKGKTKHVVYVFTDASCPYCHKLHAEIPELNKMGIEVRYVAFPRQGLGSPGDKQLQAVWCSADKKAAMDKMVDGKEIKAAKCENPVSKQFQLGQSIGVNGTPAIVLENGQVIPGYQPAAQVAKLALADK